MEKILSVCIPSYNMEKYLRRNLDSFLVPECLDTIELIVVNDGSKDRTLEIANEYKTKYPDTVVVIDKPNGHYGSCVNAALKIAKGKYFRIVDADDWVNPNALRVVMQSMALIDADMVYTQYSTYHEADGTTHIEDDVAVMPWGRTVKLSNVKFDKYLHMHQVSYRLDLLRSINYHQTEGVCYTDTEYDFIPCIHAKTIHPIQISLYQYFVGRDDQSMAPSVLVRNFLHFHKVLDRITTYPKPVESNDNYEFLRNRYIDTLFGYMVDAIFVSFASNPDWNQLLRNMIGKLQSQEYDLSKYWEREFWGCHWIKALYINDTHSRLKLKILFLIYKLRLLL